MLKNHTKMLVVLSMIFFSGTVQAANDELPPDVMSSYIEDVEAAEKALQSAKDNLVKKPQMLKLRDSQKKMISEGDAKRQELREKIKNRQDALKSEAEKIADLTSQLSPAPFNLYWAASKKDLEVLGYTLLPTSRDGYEESYIVQNPAQVNPTFKHPIGAFGNQDELWDIYVQSTPITDNNTVDKGLELYHKYYELLAQKYGNPEEVFVPYIYKETKASSPDSTDKQVIIERPSTIGGEKFLQELQEEKSELYATFTNGVIGVTLELWVNEDGQSYISIDYKNLPLRQKADEETEQQMLDDI